MPSPQSPDYPEIYALFSHGDRLVAWWKHEPSIGLIADAIGASVDDDLAVVPLVRLQQRKAVAFRGKDYRMERIREGMVSLSLSPE